jgi:hypothetical protein
VAQLGNVYRATGDQRVGQSVKTAGRLECAQRESGLLRGDKAPTKRRDRVTMAFFLQANDDQGEIGRFNARNTGSPQRDGKKASGLRVTAAVRGGDFAQKRAPRHYGNSLTPIVPMTTRLLPCLSKFR